MIAVFSMPLIMLLSFCIQSNLLDIMFFDSFSEIPASEVEAAKQMLINQNLNWNTYHIQSNIFTPLFYPLFATLPIVFFSYENGDYLQYIFTRTQKYRSTILSKCFMYASLSGTILSMGYLIFVFVGLILKLSPPEYDTGMLMNFFPNLMIENPILGGAIHAMTIYFVFGFVFGLFASAIAINTSKSYFILVVPHAYYLIIGNILSAFYNLTGVHTIHQFSPWYPVTITGQTYADWYSVYYYAFPMILISLGLIVWRFGRETKIIFK